MILPCEAHERAHIALSIRILAVAVIATLLADSVSASEPVLLKQVVDNLRSHERLYHDIELKIDYRYQLGPEGHRLDHSATEISKQDRIVLQNGKYYLDSKDRYDSVARGGTVLETIAAYDGSRTRRFHRQKADDPRGADTKLGFIVAGLELEPRIVAPHAMIMNTINVNFPLSTLLTGTSGIQADTRAVDGLFSNTSVEILEVDEENLQDHHCYRVKFTRQPEGTTRETAEIHTVWLATNRNYFAIKHTASLPSRYKTDEPYEVGTCEEFVELKPGLWFPEKVSVVLYNHIGHSPAVMQSTMDFVIQKVAVQPNYDISLFRSISFPDGTLVSEKANGETLRSYTIPIRSNNTTLSRSVVIGVCLAGVAAMVALFLARNRVRRQDQANTEHRAPHCQ